MVPMSDKDISYKKLKGPGLLSTNRLYTGPDHLLSSNSSFFSETYLRFYYKDIQAIINRKTITGKIFNIIFIVGLVLFLIPSFLFSGGWAAFFFLGASVFFILLLINLIKGSTSICHLQTPVQTARLAAIRRIKSAEKAISRLKPLIENSQGVLVKKDIQDVKQGKKLDTSFIKPDKPLIHEDGQYHLALFSLLAVSALFIILDIFHPHIFLSILAGIINLIMAIVLIIALRKQTRSNLYKNIKIMTWSIIGYLGLKYFSSYLLLIFITIQNPDIAYNQFELIKRTASISPLDHSLLMALYIFYIFFSVGVGLTGVILTAIFRKEQKSIQTSSLKEDSIPLDLEHE